MLSCPQCGKVLVRQATRRNLVESLLSLLMVYPFRCQLCTHRFRVFMGRPRLPPRREYQRLMVRYPVALRPAFVGEDAGELEGIMVNLSIRGCSIDSNVPIRKGTCLHLQIRVNEGEPPVEVDSAVVRSTHGKQLGLEFIKIRTDEENRLRDLLEARLKTQTLPG